MGDFDQSMKAAACGLPPMEDSTVLYAIRVAFSLFFSMGLLGFFYAEFCIRETEAAIPLLLGRSSGYFADCLKETELLIFRCLGGPAPAK